MGATFFDKFWNDQQYSARESWCMTANKQSVIETTFEDEVGEFEEYCTDSCECGESLTTADPDEVRESSTTSDPDESSTTLDSDEEDDTEASTTSDPDELSTTSDPDEVGETESSLQDEDQWMKIVVILLAVLLVIAVVVILYLLRRNMRYTKL